MHARDIRKLDTAFSVSNEPSIELRNQAILINADPVRAIIMRNSCLVFVPDGADSLLSILRESFREATQPEQGEVPYEFKYVCACIHFYLVATGYGLSSRLWSFCAQGIGSAALDALSLLRGRLREESACGIHCTGSSSPWTHLGE